MTAFNHTLNQQIGRVKDDWRCCDPSFEIYDETGNLKYKVWGTCCQCGFLFKSFSRFYQSLFYIFDANCNDFSESNALGRIVREQKDCVKACCTKADDFEIYFPTNATAYDKLNIIGCTLMIDYSYFEGQNSGPFCN